MKKLLWIGLLVAFLTPVSARAQSAFDGTWKFELSTAQFPEKPDVYLLQDGMYSCKTCVPLIEVKADGQDQKVSGYPYFDTISVKIVDDHTIEQTNKKDGKVNGTSKTTVSPDGDTLTFVFTDSSNTNADPVTGKGEVSCLSWKWKERSSVKITERTTCEKSESTTLQRRRSPS